MNINSMYDALHIVGKLVKIYVHSYYLEMEFRHASGQNRGKTIQVFDILSSKKRRRKEKQKYIPEAWKATTNMLKKRHEYA